MKVTIIKLTNGFLLREACESTMQSGSVSKMTLDKIYRCEHSPIRTQLFWVELLDIPTFVSVHIVRHKIGVEHFVMSNREDRGGGENVDRYTPIRHSMLINAEAILSLARKRLCYQSHPETVRVLEEIKKVMKGVDPDLHDFMVPNCVYRGGVCPELKPCGKYRVRVYNPTEITKEMANERRDIE